MAPAAITLTLATLAVTTGGARDAAGDVPAAPFLRGFREASRFPATGDDGRVSFLVPLDAASRDKIREVAPGVGAIRLTPEDAQAFSMANPEVSLMFGPPRDLLMDHADTWTAASGFREATGATGEGVVVGVVDTGIDVTHPAFIDDAGKTRIAFLMTWGEPRGKYPGEEQIFGCDDPDLAPCAIYDAEDIDAMLASGDIPVDVHDAVGHGTHVASLAAGNGKLRDGKTSKLVGSAPKATLVVAAPSKTGSLADDLILRGSTFVMNRADAMQKPVVLNLSVGGDFGPHDGTSLLEKGLAGFVGADKPGKAIVVAAGNSGDRYEIDGEGPAGIHTKVYVEDSSPARVPILIPGASAGQVFIWVRYGEDDDIQVGLEGPDDVLISPVGEGDDDGYEDDDLTVSLVNNLVNGRSQLNADTNGAVMVFNGKWKKNAEFALLLEGSGTVDAWLVAAGAAKATGAYFSRATLEGTVAVPASSPSLLAVGCTLNRTSWTPYDGVPLGLPEDFKPDSVCSFSAAGPNANGVPKPEILAPGGFVGGAMSIDADPRKSPGGIFDAPTCPEGTKCYVLNDSYAISSGTSMSAPIVAGGVALLLAIDPNLTQDMITEILQANARKPVGTAPFQSQNGPGVFFMQDALDVLTTDSAFTLGPDVQKSWMGLSRDAIEPDAVVHGTIEMRRGDFSVASGLDGNLITLSVDGGVVDEPVHKVRHGLFRFAVRAGDGDKKKDLKIVALYDGAELGNLSLPIGRDPWLGGKDPEATGGCDCALAPSSPGDRFGGTLAAVVLGVFFVVRRRSARGS